MEDIVENLISEYDFRTPDDRSGGPWHTIILNYYNNNQRQALCIHKNKSISWLDKNDKYSHVSIPIDMNHGIFIRKINHIIKHNQNFKEQLNDKLFQLEELELRRL